MAQLVKNLSAMWETWVDSWVGKIPWRREGYPLQYSGLGNPMECVVHGVTKSGTRLSDFHFVVRHIRSHAGYCSVSLLVMLTLKDDVVKVRSVRLLHCRIAAFPFLVHEYLVGRSLLYPLLTWWREAFSQCPWAENYLFRLGWA